MPESREAPSIRDEKDALTQDSEGWELFVCRIHSWVDAQGIWRNGWSSVVVVHDEYSAEKCSMTFPLFCPTTTNLSVVPWVHDGGVKREWVHRDNGFSPLEIYWPLSRKLCLDFGAMLV